MTVIVTVRSRCMTRSRAWSQRSTHQEATSRGTAVLAMEMLEGVSDPAGEATSGRVFEPDPASVDAMQRAQ